MAYSLSCLRPQAIEHALTDAARSGAASLDQMRSQAITRHADVADRIADHSRALTAVRQEIPRNFMME